MGDMRSAAPDIPGDLKTLRAVPTEPPPEKLVVCSAKIRDAEATALRAKFDNGVELVGEFASTYRDHVLYSHSISDKFYEAGPAADFSEILYAYRTGSVEEATALLRADPLYQSGAIHSDSYSPWEIHPPLYKSTMPPMPWQVVDVEVEVTTPETLIASFGEFNMEPLRDWREGRAPLPLFNFLHLYTMHGEGGIASLGVAWACGPTGDWDKALHILAVPSIEMAKFFNELEALYRWGVVRNFRYFEWCIHYPTRKATPRHKGILAALLERAGSVA